MLSYRAAVTEIESRGIMPDRPPSLEPMHEALGLAGLAGATASKIAPERVIVVAGTNGKGSVSAMLADLFASSGERVGLYTSPHLVETTERFRVGGRDLGPDEFAAAYEAVRAICVRLKLSHFETLTLMAAHIFFGSDRPVDRAVLEVGLGGTWDATNAIPHAHCVVTQLGLDHQNLLGGTLQQIARNKFGIIPSASALGRGATVVHATLAAEVQPLARQIQLETGSHWIHAPAWELDAVEAGPRFFARAPWGRQELALPGARGAANAAVAAQAYEAFGGREVARAAQALGHVRWPGRMQRIEVRGARCPVYVSGDHNPQGVASLLELLPHYQPPGRMHLVVGVGKDKDCEGVLGPLSELAGARLYLTETPFKGRSLDEYGAWLARAYAADADPTAALARAVSEANAEDLILVTGSLYLVGAVLKYCSTERAI